jgi:hypothetical protein
LKSKVLHTLQNYIAAGFGAVYYIGSNREAVAVISQAVRKVTADAAQRQEILPHRAFIAIFAQADLKERWLPSPSLIDRRFFNQAVGAPATDWPPDAVEPKLYYKHRHT